MAHYFGNPRPDGPAGSRRLFRVWHVDYAALLRRPALLIRECVDAEEPFRFKTTSHELYTTGAFRYLTVGPGLFIRLSPEQHAAEHEASLRATTTSGRGRTVDSPDDSEGPPLAIVRDAGGPRFDVPEAVLRDIFNDLRPWGALDTLPEVPRWALRAAGAREAWLQGYPEAEAGRQLPAHENWAWDGSWTRRGAGR